ncbi:MAG: alpha-L-fucosidase [Planctomycetes bacterium]|nr:alpha-L-fucosidase [Planctomycetota bacterium]
MNRSLILALALLAPSCGGEGGTTPSVKSNVEEVRSRRDEIKAIAEVPSDASREVPTLLKAMSDPDPEVRWLAEFGLGRVDARGLKALAEALRDENAGIRFAAAYVLGPMGRRAKSALPALLRAAEDKEKGVRIWSVKALADIDPFNSDVVAAILKALRDPDPDVRRVALTAVIKLGPAANGAAPVLADVLQDADASNRVKACQAFSRLASDGKSGIPALIARLADNDAEVRAEAAEALMRIGPSGLDPLVRALHERDMRVRRAAAEVLGSFGSEAKTAVVELTEIAKDDDAALKEAATQAIKRIQSGAEVPKGTSFIDAPGAVQRRGENWRWARFGLQVHAGLPSVAARAKPGQAAELIQQNDRMPLMEYELLALKFGLSKFKPEEWAKLANESGARYLVMTAKHHDGYCLWNTKTTQYKAKRDLLTDLAAACDKEGVKFGVSYSMLDWYQPTYEKNLPKYLEVMHGQVKELLAYPFWGIWFEGETGRSKEEWRSDELVTAIRQSKPLAFINDRLGRDTRATITGVDFYSQEPDATYAALKLQGRPLALEFSHPFGESWAYCESPDPLRSGEQIILEIVEAASKGGNFLLKIGARPDGSIPDAFQARLRVIGAWLRKFGDAIYDTERSPWNGPLPAGRVTVKGNRLYVFLEELPKDGIIALPGLKTPVKESWVLDLKKELKVRDTGVQAPGSLVEGSPVTVVAIELEAPPVIEK